jgi:hypothetical protein
MWDERVFVGFCLLRFLRLFRSELLGYLHRFKDVHIYLLHQHLCQYFVGHCNFFGKNFLYTNFPMIALPPPPCRLQRFYCHNIDRFLLLLKWK